MKSHQREIGFPRQLQTWSKQLTQMMNDIWRVQRRIRNLLVSMEKADGLLSDLRKLQLEIRAKSEELSTLERTTK